MGVVLALLITPPPLFLFFWSRFYIKVLVCWILIGPRLLSQHINEMNWTEFKSQFIQKQNINF